MDILTNNLEAILQALGTTLLMIVIAGVGSIILGILVTVARVSPIPVLRAAAFGYVQFFVNVPLLALLLFAVFALPDVGLLLPLGATATLVLMVYESAYVAEAVRSGVNTVDVGQVEASRALGLTLSQSLRHVIVPQSVRAVIQPIGNVMIMLTMNSALAATVGVVGLTAITNKINLVEAQPILIFSASGVIYMVIALAIGLAAGKIERKVAIVR